MAGLGRRTFAPGEVLTASNVMGYLQDQAVMNFAGTAARGSAIGSAVSEGMVSYLADSNSIEVYTGSAWNTISQATSPNAVINGAFDIWQRGTSFSNPNNQAYVADRWKVSHDGTGATRTVSQQTFTAGTAPVTGYEGAYFLRYAVTGAGSGNSYQDLNHTIEDVRTFAGQTVTLSFWAKADATRSLSLLWRREWDNYAGADQNSMGSALSLTTSWARYSVTYTVPSLTGITVGTNSNVRLIFRFAPATTQTIDIWGVQLEAGTTATTFRRNSPNIQAELASCQRYTPVIYGTANDIIGFAYGTTGSQYVLKLPVTARTNPTGITVSSAAHFLVYNQSFNAGAPSSITFNSGGLETISINATTTAGSPTIATGQPVKLSAGNNSAARIIVEGCEL